MTILTGLLLLVACGAGDNGTPPEALTPEMRPHYDILLNTESFGGTFGFGPEVPGNTMAFRALVEMPDAGAVFRDLLEKATPEGRMYALCGLWYTDHDSFLTAAEELKGSCDQVMIQSGDMFYPMAVASVIESPDSSVVRLDHIGQTPEEWLRENSLCDGSFITDMIGGGWPSLLRFGHPLIEGPSIVEEPVIKEPVIHQAPYSGG